jgi:2-isopropylmalate synthase
MQTMSKAQTITEEAASEKDRVLIFDTTLRDGEQSPGATMTVEEQLQVAALLLSILPDGRP